MRSATKEEDELADLESRRTSKRPLPPIAVATKRLRLATFGACGCILKMITRRAWKLEGHPQVGWWVKVGDDTLNFEGCAFQD